MSRFITWTTRGWHPWLVIGIWMALATIPFVGPSLSRHTSSDMHTLPSKAESMRADALGARAFPQAEGTTILVAYASRQRLTAADRGVIAAQAAWLARASIGRVDRPRTQSAPDGKAAITALTLAGEPGDASYQAAVKSVADHVGARVRSLEIRVTGQGGLGVDSARIFSSIDSKLLVGSVLIVLVLMLFVYRSPLLPLVTILTVGVAYAVATGVLAGVATLAHYTMSKIALSMMIVLLFGAGTDYTLLLISRYRENLRRGEDCREALAYGLSRTWGAIAASGVTVALAILAFSFARLPIFSPFAPVIAAGIGVTFIAALTLMPALLAVLGRAAFWPRRPSTADAGTHRLWQGVAGIVTGAPKRAVLVVGLVLLTLAVGVVVYEPNLNFMRNFTQSTPATQGWKMVEDHFPAGMLAPTTMYVSFPATATRSQSDRLLAALRSDPAARAAAPAGTGAGGRILRYQVVLRGDPFGKTGVSAVTGLRDRVHTLAASLGGAALVGGPTMNAAEVWGLSNRDTIVVGAIALTVAAAVLGLLLRSLLVPAVLLVVNVLSFGAALGLTMVITEKLFGWNTFGFQVLLYIFIFLVALGSDYNIFICTRIRHESCKHGVRLGTAKAVAATGGVLTSAGVVLAGTFLVLTSEPIKYMVEVGLGVALGVLIDTFLVRTALVPGLVTAVGSRAGWPGRRWRP